MATIGVFDSGSGGLSVLKELRKVLPEEKYVYYSDNANCPYGDKTPEFIQDRARSITDLLLEKGFRYASVSNSDNLGAAPNAEQYEVAMRDLGER